MRKLSSFLFARPSFLEGASRVLDLGGTLQEYNASRTGEQADGLALAADWRILGAELRSAMNNVSDEESVKINDELLYQAQQELEPAYSKQLTCKR